MSEALQGALSTMAQETKEDMVVSVQDNLDKPWNWLEVSLNPNITLEIIQDNPDKPWNWIYFSSNPNIKWEFIQQNPDKPWGWYTISSHPNITCDVVKANPDKPWDWGCVSNNPNISSKSLVVSSTSRFFIKMGLEHGNNLKHCCFRNKR